MATKFQLSVQLLTGRRGPASVIYDNLQDAKDAKATAMEYGVSQEDGTDNDTIEVGWPASAIACIVISKVEIEE